MLAVAWKGLGWFLGSVAVTLGFLLVPLQVAAERKKLDRTVSEISQAQRDIRALETEFETRGNIAQLEKWNGDTLRLAAPVPVQFMPDEAALAQVDFTRPAQGGAQVQLASIVPSRSDAVVTPAVMTQAVAAPAGSSPAKVIPASAVIVRTAAVAAPAATREERSVSRPVVAEAIAQTRTAPVKRAKPQAVALLDRQLLSDSMLGDLTSAASREARSR